MRAEPAIEAVGGVIKLEVGGASPADQALLRVDDGVELPVKARGHDPLAAPVKGTRAVFRREHENEMNDWNSARQHDKRAAVQLDQPGKCWGNPPG